MNHWTDRFLNIPHAQLDCAQLVQKVLAEHYSRSIQFPQKQSNNLFHRAALITQHARDFARPIDQPVEGCGVLMYGRGRMAHMGIYCVLNGIGHILHSDSLFGHSTLLPFARAQPPLYKLQGFYEWID
jgi:hypothetical protein